MKYIRPAIVLLFLLLVGWQAVFSTAPVVTRSNFFNRTNYWSMIMPAGRVVKKSAGIMINEEPVYFELKLPPRTKSIKLTLEYTGNGNVNLGVRRGVDWNYEFVPAVVEVSNQATIYEMVVDSPNYLESNHAQRFLISVTSLQPGEVVIKKVKAEIIRQQISLEKIWHSLVNQ